MYKRYQNRPEQNTPLKLANFGWHVDTQAKLRLACDTIMNVNEEELVDAYMASTEVPFKIELCTKFCTRASMIFQLNAWYGKDINGNILPEDETEYVDGMLKADALAKKNKKDYKIHKRKVALDDKKKAREEKKEEAEERQKNKDADFNGKMVEELDTEPRLAADDLTVGDQAFGQDGNMYAVADDNAADAAAGKEDSAEEAKKKKKTKGKKMKKKKKMTKKKTKEKEKKAEAKDEL